MNIIRWFKKSTTVTGFLLPITLIVAIASINQLAEAPNGDTSFAWLPILLFIPVIFSIIIILLFGLFKNIRVQSITAIGLPVLIYTVSFLYFSTPGDGLPRTLLGIVLWFGGMLVCIFPMLVALYKNSPS